MDCFAGSEKRRKPSSMHRVREVTEGGRSAVASHFFAAVWCASTSESGTGECPISFWSSLLCSSGGREPWRWTCCSVDSKSGRSMASAQSQS